MKQFLTFIKKEFLHVFRDKKTMFILFGMPIAQLLIFGFALTNEAKNAKLVIIDRSKDEMTQELTQKIAGSSYFQIYKTADSPADIKSEFQKGDAKIALIFPSNFARDLQRDKQTTIQIIADASNPNYATTLTNYLRSIIMDFQREQHPGVAAHSQILPDVRMLYNPLLKSASQFVPGVISLILMLVCVMMTAVSIVREKETGTMEILLVSPFRPALVIIAKAIPYLALSLIDVLGIIVLSTFVFDVPVQGNMLLFLAETTLFIITCLSFGLLISVKVKSRQTALMISLMGMLLPTILFSGFMFPITNMPLILQWISNIIPAKWYYNIAQAIMVKGLGFMAVWKETLILFVAAIFLLFVSFKSFKTRLS